MIAARRRSADRPADVSAILRDDHRLAPPTSCSRRCCSSGACRPCASCRRTTTIPAYLDAMTQVIRDDLAKLPWEPDHFVLSFHGIPIRVRPGAATRTRRTSSAPRARWSSGSAGSATQWTQTFQSLFGRERWLKPYTDDVLQRAGASRARSGCSSPCRASRPIAWRRSTRSATSRARCSSTPAARRCTRCPCLNDHPAWIDAMRTIIAEEGQGWL